MKTPDLIRATDATPTPRCTARHKRAPKQREWWMRPLLEESITYRANGAVPKSTTWHQRGVLHFVIFSFRWRRRPLHDLPYTSKTRDNFSIIVLERRNSTARIACNKRGQEQLRAWRAKKCDEILRSWLETLSSSSTNPCETWSVNCTPVNTARLQPVWLYENNLSGAPWPERKKKKTTKKKHFSMFIWRVC